METAGQQDALGPVVLELRAYLALHGNLGTGIPDLSATPVYGGQRAAGAAGPPYVLVQHQGQRRRSRVPLIDMRLAVRSFGRDPREASRLAGLVSQALHDRGPRTRSGTGLYSSREEVGAQAGQDAATGWPYEFAVYVVALAAQAVG